MDKPFMILVGVVLALILVVNFIPDTVEDSGMMLAPSFERSLGDIQKDVDRGVIVNSKDLSIESIVSSLVKECNDKSDNDGDGNIDLGGCDCDGDENGPGHRDHGHPPPGKPPIGLD